MGRIVFSSSPTDFTELTNIDVTPPICWLRLFQAEGFAAVSGFDFSVIIAHAFLLGRREFGRRGLFAHGELVRTRRRVAEQDQAIRNLHESANDCEQSFADLQTSFEELGRSIRALDTSPSRGTLLGLTRQHDPSLLKHFGSTAEICYLAF
jgi:hypothetical protein